MLENLKQLFEDSGMTQAAFVDGCDISSVIFGRILRGEQELSLQLLHKIAEKHQVSANWLAGFDDAYDARLNELRQQLKEAKAERDRLARLLNSREYRKHLTPVWK